MDLHACSTKMECAFWSQGSRTVHPGHALTHFLKEIQPCSIAMAIYSHSTSTSRERPTAASRVRSEAEKRSLHDEQVRFLNAQSQNDQQKDGKEYLEKLQVEDNENSIQNMMYIKRGRRDFIQKSLYTAWACKYKHSSLASSSHL